jgi:dolichol-phosphate mannosyltransferase
MTTTPASALVIIPTYNEIDNLSLQVALVLESTAEVHVLIVDDNSPDGTGCLADELAANDRVFALHRDAKNGLGAAYIAGFAWALERNYDVVVEMDADGSHPASVLPELLHAVHANAGLVIGSRWVADGQVVDWPRSREILSRLANSYARFALRLKTRDVTGGYRAYTAAALRTIPFETVRSRGYCFQIDMTVRTADAGFSIAEVPITFRERRAGVSKMTLGIVVEAMVSVTAWGITRAFARGIRTDSRNPAATRPGHDL